MKPYSKIKTLTAIVSGGLGNQLFIYAFARAYSKLHSTELILDDITAYYADKYDRSFLLGEFNIECTLTSSLRINPIQQKRKYILLAALNQLVDFKYKNYLKERSLSYSHLYLQKTLSFSSSLVASGYWQSYKYFDSIKSDLATELTLKNKSFIASCSDFNKRDPESSVAVHVRFFTDDGAEIYSSEFRNYYIKAISYARHKLRSPTFYVFTNNPRLASLIFEEYSSIVRWQLVPFLGEESPLQEFELMRRFKHFIIANSTFSWWAAWLSSLSAQACTIVAPTNGFLNHSVAWGHNGLIPHEWIQL